MNVLAITAIATAGVMLMVSTQQDQLTRSILERESVQARAYVRGGELSAITALRRDMVEAPEVDHLREPWADIADREIEIRGGRFTLEISDAQDRFNVNSLVSGGLLARGALESVVGAAGLPTQVTERIAVFLSVVGPVSNLGELAAAGLGPVELSALEPLMTALPPSATLNVNTASPEVMGAVLKSPVAGRLLAQRREQRGYVTPQDLEGVGVIAPLGVGYTSDHFRVSTEVQVGDVRQRATSLIQRRRVLGEPEVTVIARRREPARLAVPDAAGGV